MSFLKTACLTLASAAIFSFASAANANTLTSVANGVGAQPELSNGKTTPGHVGDRYFGSSETATFYFKKGLSKLESGKLDKASAAFEASLRADGSKSMDKYTLHYLAYINQQQGDNNQAKRYASAYLELVGK